MCPPAADRLVFAQWEPVAGGRSPVLATGAATTLTRAVRESGCGPLQLVADGDWVMTAFALAGLAVPWHRMPTIATAAVPVLVWSVLAPLGIGSNGLGANFTGSSS